MKSLYNVLYKLEDKDVFSELDFVITPKKKNSDAIKFKLLKNNKAFSFDISNEILKSGQTIYLPPLTKKRKTL